MMTETNPFLRALFGEDKPATNGHVNGVAMPAKLVGEATPYGERALNLEVDAVLNTPEGQRNDRLNTAAFNLAQLVAGGELNQADVEQSLTLAGHTAGLDAREVPATIRSGITAGLKLPRNAPPRPDQGPGVAPEPVTQPQPAFWASRDRLQALHDWAKARGNSPWAVLGVALTRVVAATPHQIVIPPLVGGVASLNMFVGLVGGSGMGKDTAQACAEDALPIEDTFNTAKVGSGEGIAHQYMRRVKTDIEQHTYNVLFTADEIDSWAALGARQSSTLIPELRSAWSGSALGFAYSDPAKRLPVPKHQYRLCLIAGIQPARSGALLNDADGGTPQRFLWFPVNDPYAPDYIYGQTTDPPDPIRWSRPNYTPDPFSGQHRVTITRTAVQTIGEARVARLRGEGDALDGHALLCRLKTAVALALLDERLDVTDSDWDLAGTIQDVSDRTRAYCENTLANAFRVSNEARARAEAARSIVKDEQVEEAAAQRVARKIIRILGGAEPDGLSHSELRRKVTSKDRGQYIEALERALKAGQITTIDTPHGTRYRSTEETQ